MVEDYNQERLPLPLWEHLGSLQKEILDEGIDLLAKLLDRLKEKDARLFNEVYLPLTKRNGLIGDQLIFNRLCADLHVDPVQINGKLEAILDSLQEPIGTEEASIVLRVTIREVRHLIASKQLPAIKNHQGHWEINVLDAMRLAVARPGC
jgi:hypothetical protein